VQSRVSGQGAGSRGQGAIPPLACRSARRAQAGASVAIKMKQNPAEFCPPPTALRPAITGGSPGSRRQNSGQLSPECGTPAKRTNHICLPPNELRIVEPTPNFQNPKFPRAPAPFVADRRETLGNNPASMQHPASVLPAPTTCSPNHWPADMSYRGMLILLTKLGKINQNGRCSLS